MKGHWDSRVPPTHITDRDIDRFCSRQLPPADILRFTDHVAACGDCQRRLRARSNPSAGLAAIEDELEGLADHVPEDEIHAYVDGRVDSSRRQEIARHLDACRSCAAEVRELEAVAAAGRQPARSRATMVAALAAAAVAIVVIGASLVFRVAPSGSEEDGLTARQREVVRQARSTEQLPLPPVLSDLGGTRGRLMGNSDAAPFELLRPIGTAVLDDRPTFRWTPAQGAARYSVTLLDATTGETSTSPSLAATEWTPPLALVRGRVYVWQVAAAIDGRDLVVPTPPAPPAKFLVLDASVAADIERLPPSPLVRGILYADAGLLDDAERELAAVPIEDAASAVAASLLKHLQDARARSSR